MRQWLDEQFEIVRTSERNSLSAYDDNLPLGSAPPPSQEDPEVILFAEFIGTFFLVFVGVSAIFCSSAITLEVLEVSRLFYVSFTYGMVYASLMYTLSFSSPNDRYARHLNPAVSLSVFLLGRLKFRRMILYIFVQLIGGLIAIGIVHISTPNLRRIKFTVLDNVTYLQEILMSIIVSFISVFVMLVTNFHDEPNDSEIAIKERVNFRELTMSRVNGAPPDPDADINNLAPIYQRHNQNLEKGPPTFHSNHAWSTAGKDEAVQTIHEINAIMSGIIIFLCSCVGSTVSGGFMNPVVALSLATLTGDALLAPIVGPLVGAALAAGTLFLINPKHYHKIS